MDFPILTLLIFLPLVGVLLMQTISSKAETSVRISSLWFSLLTFAASLALPFLYDEKTGGLQLFDRADWIPSLGINYTVAIDGISLWLIVLTTLTTPIVILASWRSVDRHVKSFHVCVLVLEAAIIGAFVAQNLILFYLFWEAMLVPMALLIGIWGGGRRIYSAFKFFLFTAAGSLPMLLAILFIWHQIGAATGVRSFELSHFMQYREVAEAAAVNAERLADPSAADPGAWFGSAMTLCFWAFCLAFAVKVPIFPLHTWLPDAHSDAPTGGSVILAGVLLKMGIYGFIRFAIPIFPEETIRFAGVFQTLAVVGIVYGAFMAIVQTDIKRLVAYSSVSHLGYCVLGLFTLTHWGIAGSVYQMLAHGVSTGGLFLLVGMIYDRRHTREISDYGGVAAVMPKYARMFLIITLASVGLPATVGFVGEFLILLGSFKWAMAHWASSYWPMIGVVLATSGVILGAIYMLRLYQNVFFGEVTNAENQKLEDLNVRERATLWPLIALVFVMGVIPGLFLIEMDTTISQIVSLIAGVAK